MVSHNPLIKHTTPIHDINLCLGNRWNADKLVPYKDLIRDIEGKYGRLQKVSDDPNDTTKAFRVPGYAGKVGFITSMSDHFCGTCNRLRITTDGNLKVCLFGAAEVSLRDYMRQSANDDDLCDIIGMAVKKKKKQHAGMFELAAQKNRPMILIGG
jgi:cyclic pyranopterin phosphate synthase